MKNYENSISVISGADGPTGVFAGDSESKKSLKEKIQNYIYILKRKKAENKIVANAHTIEEVVAYAVSNYGAVEVNSTDGQYKEQRKSLKESLVLMNRPELLGEMKDIQNPDFSNENETRKFLKKIKDRQEFINKISESEMPMAFHMYEIKIDDSQLEIQIDKIWNIFSVSCCGNRKAMKKLNKILKDLYLYYGVSKEDIREKSDRYLSLLNVLSI